MYIYIYIERERYGRRGMGDGVEEKHDKRNDT